MSFSFQSLGNHEFDEGVDGVIPFIRNLSAPVVAANLKLDKVPEMKDMVNLHKSIIIVKDRVKIGIIGYLTPETKFLVPKNYVEYEDEIIAITREVKTMKEQGVGILIALGHAGFVKDLEIARSVEDLDLVIGGHSNTFLWNDNRTTEIPEVPQGHYPTVVKQAGGRTVRVVQAYAFTKYLGKLHIKFDSDGEIIECNGDPILLDQEIPRDPELLQIVNKYREDVNRKYDQVVGSSDVFLNGDCRLRECNLGDFIADAVLNYTHEVYNDEYPDVNLALIQGGRIRTTIDHPGRPMKLTRGDWITVLPFSDMLTIVTMNGTILKQSLEHSVSTWRVIDSTGQFQQMSGIKVTYDLARPVGSRVVALEAVCSNCSYKDLSEVKDYDEYRIIMPSFIAEGGDGYVLFADLPMVHLAYNEMDCVLYYLSKHSPVSPQLDSRIQILNEDKVSNDLIKVSNARRLSSAASNNYSKVYKVILAIVLCRYL